MNKYRLFGITIESEMSFPDLIIDNANTVDVTIRIGEVPRHLPHIEHKGVMFELSKSAFLLQIDTIGSYLVKNGNEIIIQPHKSASEEEIKLFLFGSVMGALLLQKRVYPLHGSSIVKNNRAIVFSGNSSSGKSTLAVGMMQRGCKLISDDISAINYNDAGDLQIQPGIPLLKLWSDVIKNLNIKGSYDRIRPHLKKYKYPVNSNFTNEPRNLEKIIILETKNSRGFILREIFGAEKFLMLQRHTYRSQFINEPALKQFQFNMISKISQETQVFRLQRPASPLLISELVDYILNEI